MIKKILVATDFSDSAKQALKQGGELARAGGAELIVLHVREPLPYLTPDGYGYLPLELDLQQKEIRERLLAAEIAELEKQGVAARGLHDAGSPALKIVEVAESQEADLIVLGFHGRHGLPRLILGSVAERVARTSKVPALVVRSAAPAYSS